MKGVEKNKLYFLKTTGQNIYITSVVEYKGTKQISVNYTVGYGASEKRINKVFSYVEYEDFCNNLETNQKIKVMESETNEKDNFKELRSILFDTLRGVKNGTIDEKKAKTISDVSQTLINTAKVEIDYIRVTGNKSKSKMIE